MSLLQPIKKSGVYSIFGKHYGDYLINFITGYCTDIGTLCTSIKHCIGISPQGDSNLILNQQGNWITSSSDIQDLLSDLPEYLGAKEASEDGKPLGYWYYNTFYNSVSKVTQYIDSYTAGTSPITFTPDGSNGWNVGIVANPTTVQIPSGVTIDSVDYEITFYQGGSEINAISGNLTSDDTINTGANGAGAYLVQLTYLLSNGSYFTTSSLIVVNSTDAILHYFKGEGTVVNSVSGMNIDVTASIETTISSPNITWIAYNGAFSNVGTGINDILSLPIGTTDVGYKVALTSDFSDYPDPDLLVAITVVIS